MSVSTYDTTFPPNYISQEVPAVGVGEVTIEGDDSTEVRVVELLLQNRSNKSTEVRFTQGDGTTEYFSWRVNRDETVVLPSAIYSNGLELDCEDPDIHVFVTFYVKADEGR